MACRVNLDVIKLIFDWNDWIGKQQLSMQPVKSGEKQKTIKCLIFTKLFAERFVEQSAFFKTKQTR